MPILGRGRYAVEELLGEGGQKRVYRAEDRMLGRSVALTVLNSELFDSEATARARNELEATGRLGEHQNVVTIYDVGEEDGLLYVVAQYVSDPSLDQVVTGAGRLPLEQSIAIAMDICSGLAYAHGHQVLHRGLKPRRVWLCGETAKIGDFSVSVRADRMTFTMEGSSLGSVHYMPPEQALGRELEPSGDLYSLGALLYELICGRAPFVGDRPLEIISQHVQADPPAPSLYAELPSGLEQLVLKLLAKSPDERPPNAVAVSEVLAGAAAALSTQSSAVKTSVSSPAEQAEPTIERLGELFVGRESERDSVRAALAQVHAGHGMTVLLEGEAGIGKTRLAQEIVLEAQAEGFEVQWGRCHHGDGAPVYWPFAQILRAYAKSRDPAALARQMGSGAVEIAQVVGEVREKLPGLPAAKPSEPEHSRLQLFEAIAGFLRSASSESPAILVIDDLHWADKGSLNLLRFLTEEAIGRSRLLLIGTYRHVDLEEGHPLRAIVEALEGCDDVMRVSLGGLAWADVVNFLEQAAGQTLDETGQALAAAVHRESEGNPFFIRELLRHLVESGAVHRRDGRWVSDAPSIEGLGLPEGIREVIGSRLARLPEPGVRLLARASVIGRRFDPEVLEAVFAGDRTEFDELLLTAVRASLLVRVQRSPERYEFSHALIRETLYEGLSTARLVRLHERVAEVLEDRYAEDPARSAELAHHFRLAGDSHTDKAVFYAVCAARHAAEQFAYEQAADHAGRALESMARLPSPPAQRRYEIMMDLGTWRWNAGDFQQARSAFLKAAEIATEDGQLEQLAEAALGFGGRLGFGAGVNDEDLIRLLERALVGLEQDNALRARVMARLAEALSFAGVPARVHGLAEGAVSIARRIGDPSLLGSVLTSAHWALWLPENLEERLAMAREIVACGERTSDRSLAMDGHLWTAADLLELGDIVAADHEVEVWSDLAHRLQQLYHLWLIAVYRAMRALMQGRLDDAESLAQQAFALGQRGQNENAIQLFGVQMAGVRRDQGRYLELEEGLKGFVAQYPAITTWRCALALMYSESDMREAARTEFEAIAQQGFDSLPRDLFWLTTIVQLAQTCAYLGDSSRALILYELLSAIPQRNVAVGTVASCWGSTVRSLALLQTTMGALDQAERHFQEALEFNQRIGARAWHGQTLQEYASMLRGRDEGDDREQAAILLKEAGETANELGLKRLAAKVSSELAALGQA